MSVLSVYAWSLGLEEDSSELSGKCVELEAMRVRAAAFLLMIVAQNSLRLGSGGRLLTKMLFSSTSSK